MLLLSRGFLRLGSQIDLERLLQADCRSLSAAFLNASSGCGCRRRRVQAIIYLSMHTTGAVRAQTEKHLSPAHPRRRCVCKEVAKKQSSASQTPNRAFAPIALQQYDMPSARNYPSQIVGLYPKFNVCRLCRFRGKVGGYTTRRDWSCCATTSE